MPIPIAKPSFDEEEKNVINEVLESGILANGPNIVEFEKEFAKYIGTKYAIATSSGTTALHLTNLYFRNTRGFSLKILTTPFTFIATSNSIILADNTIRYGRIDRTTYNLIPDVHEVNRYGGSNCDILPIVDKMDIHGILPVHLYGCPCEMDKFKEISENHGYFIIEDAAQACGSEWKGKKVGAWGDAGCFSFYPSKNMTCGEGGMITTDDPDIASFCRKMRNHGGDGKTPGSFNFRMSEIEAVMGIVQLRKLPSFIQRRLEVARRYRSEIDHPEIIHPSDVPGHSYNLYTIRSSSTHRDKFVSHLNKSGVGARIYYSHTSVNEAKEVFSIPIYPSLTDDEVNRVIKSVNEVVT